MPGSNFGSLINIDPSQDLSQQIAFINQNFQALASSLNPIQISDGSNNRILLGKDSAGNYVSKVSKAGYDAFNATDANLIFNSNQNVFKIIRKVSGSIPAFNTDGTGNGSVTYTVAHGQSFQPIVNVFCQATLLNFGSGAFISSSYIPLPISPSGTGNGYWFPMSGGGFYCKAEIAFAVDSTNIYIQASMTSAAATNTALAIPVSIFVLQESAT